MSLANLNRKGLLKAILIAGFVVAILIAMGTTLNFLNSGGKNPIRLLHFVASGIFGEDAFVKEIHSYRLMAALGMLLHTLISLCWSFIYFILWYRITIHVKNTWLSGIAYGILIWFVMAFIVMPLSNAPPVPFKLSSAWIDVLIIITCAGLPVSFFAKNHYAKYST